MDFGKLLIVTGAIIVIIGLLLKFAPWLLNWFGRLPGDIHIKNAHSSVHIPFASMILISLVLTILLNLFLRK